MLEVPLRRSGGGKVCHCAALLAMARRTALFSGYDFVLALNNATGSALDADQVTETDVVGGDVVAL